MRRGCEALTYEGGDSADFPLDGLTFVIPGKHLLTPEAT